MEISRLSIISPRFTVPISGIVSRIPLKSTTPERSMEFPAWLKAEEKSNAPAIFSDKALSSKPKASARASSSTVMRESISKSFSLCSSPKGSPVNTLISGLASCCLTISLSAAFCATYVVRDAGYPIPEESTSPFASSEGCTTPTILRSSPASTTFFI